MERSRVRPTNPWRLRQRRSGASPRPWGSRRRPQARVWRCRPRRQGALKHRPRHPLRSRRARLQLNRRGRCLHLRKPSMRPRRTARPRAHHRQRCPSRASTRQAAQPRQRLLPRPTSLLPPDRLRPSVNSRSFRGSLPLCSSLLAERFFSGAIARARPSPLLADPRSTPLSRPSLCQHPAGRRHRRLRRRGLPLHPASVSFQHAFGRGSM